MDKDKKVKVISTIPGTVTLQLPNLNFVRVWPGKNSAVMIPYSVLEEGIFDIGFGNALRSGDLYIEDMEVKKELGLEPEDAKEPQNIIVLSDNKMLFLLKTASLEVFKDTLEKISLEQANNLAQYAIDNQINDYNKTDLIKAKTGRDVAEIIKLERQSKVD